MIGDSKNDLLPFEKSGIYEILIDYCSGNRIFRYSTSDWLLNKKYICTEKGMCELLICKTSVTILQIFYFLV